MGFFNFVQTCFINEEGNFDNEIPELKGMPALSLGTTKVLKELKAQVIHTENYLHSYPYDWRTKKPVIVRTSMQWFLDTEQLKSRSVVSFCWRKSLQTKRWKFGGEKSVVIINCELFLAGGA